VEIGRATDDGMVVTEHELTVQREEIAEERLDIVEGVRPFRVSGELDLLPGGGRDRSVVARPGTGDARLGALAFACFCNSKSLTIPFLVYRSSCCRSTAGSSGRGTTRSIMP